MKKILKALIPMSVRNLIQSFIDEYRRKFPKKHEPDSRHGLKFSQVYPKGINFDEVLLRATTQRAGKLKINKQTRIASIGSCFAEEFAYFMIDHQYNYLRAAEDTLKASCDWGRVYTIPCLKQIVDYSIRPDFPLIIEQCQNGWFDPLREQTTPFYSDYENAKTSIIKHRANSKIIFKESEVLVITLGQNESWIDSKTKLAWAKKPSKYLLTQFSDRFFPKEAGYEENVSDLTWIITQLFNLNSQLKIILTVSPVPAHASFLNEDVICQSFSNKCLLRTVVRAVETKFINRVYYFPSFETVLAYNPYSLRSDNRHVKLKIVKRIFQIFEKSFAAQK